MPEIQITDNVKLNFLDPDKYDFQIGSSVPVWYKICTINYNFYILLECTCNGEGYANEICDVNGQCTCKSNVIGKDCDSCAFGFFGFPDCQGRIWCIHS